MDGFCSSAREHYERSVRIYQTALKTCKHCRGNAVNMASIVKRLANSLNELAVNYMHLAATEIDKSKSVALRCYCVLIPRRVHDIHWSKYAHLFSVSLGRHSAVYDLARLFSALMISVNKSKKVRVRVWQLK